MRRFKCLNFKKHAEEEGIRAQHERRVINNLQDLIFVIRDLFFHISTEESNRLYISFMLRDPLVNSAVGLIKSREQGLL